ncbi:MAG: SRPBCC family protein [Chloracidobacterium sp.]|nr:SRPBCC family protein [Chloracidobacterium sp.]
MFSFLKIEMRNWAVINLLLCGLGRIGEIPAVRKRAMKLGLSRWGAAIDSSIGSKLFGRRRAGTGISSAITACATLGTGAGLMYLFDPERGACRRARLRDKGVHAINKTGAAAGSVSRDLSNRVRGIAAQAGSVFKSCDIDDDTLSARVRSRMGRTASHPGAIEVTALNGVVRLGGDALIHEVNALIACARSTPGARGVDNQLRIHNRPGDIPNLQGGQDRRRRGGPRFELMQSNWAPATRLLAAMTGGALIGLCLRRRDALGAAAGTLGFGLILRGATNLESRRILGIGGGRRAIDFHKTINIDAPVELVFEFWSNPQNFPHFMTNVREVRDLGNGRSQWTVAGPASISVKWNAVVTDLIPNRIIAWKSEPGSAIANAGIIRFDPNNGAGTRVTVRMSYNPPAGAIGHAFAKIFGASPKREMDQDLLRMKTLIETGHPPHDAAQPIRDFSPHAKPNADH